LQSRLDPFNASLRQLEHNYLIENQNKRDKVIKLIEVLVKIDFLVLKIFNSLILFSLLVNKLDTRLRYPVFNNQSQILANYNKKDKFINILPDFQYELELVFKNIKKFTKLITNLKGSGLEQRSS